MPHRQAKAEWQLVITAVTAEWTHHPRVCAWARLYARLKGVDSVKEATSASQLGGFWEVRRSPRWHHHLLQAGIHLLGDFPGALLRGAFPLLADLDVAALRANRTWRCRGSGGLRNGPNGLCPPSNRWPLVGLRRSGRPFHSGVCRAARIAAFRQIRLLGLWPASNGSRGHGADGAARRPPRTIMGSCGAGWCSPELGLPLVVQNSPEP